MEIKPPQVPFLPSKSTLDEKPGGIIFGAPLDKTETFRPGTQRAPDRIREVSDSLESYSMVLKRDLSEINIIDWGNIELIGLNPQEAVSKVKKITTQAREESFFIMIGGEHTITAGSVDALRNVYKDLQVIVFDAHLDLRYSYMEQEFSHATVSRRISEMLSSPLDLIQLGIRSGIEEEMVYLKKMGHYFCDELVIPKEVRKRIRDKPVYISIDIDVLDPSVAPGTGNPEPGGFTYQELFSILYSLKDYSVIGIDVTEVSPPYDAGDITSVTAAKIIRESLLLWAK